MIGADAIIKCLEAEGVSTVFGYPGGQIMPLYDALYDYSDDIHHVLTSHEQGATHAADGYARSTGKVGVAFATSMSVVVCGVLNMCSARKLSTALSFRPYLRLLPFLALCGAVCGVIARFSATHLAAQNPLLRFALSALIGMAAYAVCASPLLLRLWRQLRQNNSSKS